MTNVNIVLQVATDVGEELSPDLIRLRSMVTTKQKDKKDAKDAMDTMDPDEPFFLVRVLKSL